MKSKHQNVYLNQSVLSSVRAMDSPGEAQDEEASSPAVCSPSPQSLVVCPPACIVLANDLAKDTLPDT